MRAQTLVDGGAPPANPLQVAVAVAVPPSHRCHLTPLHPQTPIIFFLLVLGSSHYHYATMMGQKMAKRGDGEEMVAIGKNQ